MAAQQDEFKRPLKLSDDEIKRKPVRAGGRDNA
jgi:hypothetical protein